MCFYFFILSGRHLIQIRHNLFNLILFMFCEVGVSHDAV